MDKDKYKSYVMMEIKLMGMVVVRFVKLKVGIHVQQDLDRNHHVRSYLNDRNTKII